MEQQQSHPAIIIISGPSGAGEDSIIEGLRPFMEFNRVITTVTRPMRPGESEGNPYYFVSLDAFKKLIDEDALIEWAVVYDNYRGCTKKEIERVIGLGKTIIWKADWKGVVTIKKLFPDARAILIAPPSIEALEKRLINRGQDSMATISQRKEYSVEWLDHQDVYDVTVVNEEGKLTETIQKVFDYIQGNK